MSSIVEDAAKHVVIRHRLHDLREAVVSQVPLVDRALQAAAPLTTHLSPWVNRLDDGVSDVICKMHAASVPQTIPHAALPSFSADKLLDEATNGKFLAGRIDDMQKVSDVVRNTFEEKVGAIPRLMLHSSIAVNHWWAAPLTSAMTTVSSPVIDFLDKSIGKIVEPVRNNSEGGQITLQGVVAAIKQQIPGIPQSLSADEAGKALKELLRVDVIAYAELVIERAKNVATSAKSSEQLNSALETASAHLAALKTTLTPHAQSLLNRLHKVAEIGRQARFKTRSFTENFWDNFSAAYGKTKDLTESTLVYLDTHDMRLIPSDVYSFCMKTFGMTDRDEQYEHFLKQLKELFDSLTHVFMLTQQKPPEPASDELPSHIAASPIAA